MRLGLIGYGTIATTLIDLMRQTLAPVDHLAVLCRPGREAEVRAALADAPARATSVVTDAAGLIKAGCDLVVECAGHSAVSSHISDVLRAGVDVVVVSVGALADVGLHDDLIAAAQQGGARLILPAGAVGGIDLLAALGASGDVAVTYRGVKPPAAWVGTAAEDSIDLATLTQAATFFTGTAREAAQTYPKNANVAATLALAGAGFETTRVELVADPAAPGNVHQYSVTSKLTRVTMRIENQPSGGNVKTSVTTVWSVLREIRNRLGPVAI